MATADTSTQIVDVAPAKFARPLARIALFGGSNEISKAAGKYITKHRPDVALRLLVRRREAEVELRTLFPNAEIELADYFDKASLAAALAGVDAAFIITPDFFDEAVAMANVAEAAKSADVQHLVRLTGDPPGMTLDRVPDFIKRGGNVPSIQHLYAREALEKSGLPVTFLNSAAFFMQTMTTPLFAHSVKKDRVLVMPFDRKMAFNDKVDIGECAAVLLLSDDGRHVGATYHLNNGQDLLSFKEFAVLLSDVLKEEVHFDGSEETFLAYNAEPLAAFLKIPDAGKLVLEMIKFEKANEHAWRRSDTVEYLLGRPAKNLREWLQENADQFERV